MANRNNTTANSAPSDDNDDIPVEMDSSAVQPPRTSANSNGNTSSSGGMSLDELDAKGYDNERDERLRAAMDPPPGDWFKKGFAEPKQRTYVNDNQPDDIDPAGRTVFNYQVEVEPKVMGEHVYTPVLFLKISPDARFKEDKPNEVDMSHKLWLRAKDAYIAIKEERPSIKQLVMFLATSEDIALRTMKGDGGPVVLDVKKKVERRVRR